MKANGLVNFKHEGQGLPGGLAIKTLCSTVGAQVQSLDREVRSHMT